MPVILGYYDPEPYRNRTGTIGSELRRQELETAEAQGAAAIALKEIAEEQRLRDKPAADEAAAIAAARYFSRKRQRARWHEANPTGADEEA